MDNKKYGMAELLAEFGDQFDKYEEQHAEKQDEVVEEPEKPEEEKQQEHKPEVLKDITIKCKKCEKDWIWTVKDQEFYKDTDLSIGTTINVWGRKVLLCDCDDFTKTYYRTKYGIGKWYICQLENNI